MPRRHKSSGVRLGRNHNQRKALFKGLISSLVLNEEIKTTQTKAKAIQRIFDKLVTKSKPATVHARRLVHAFLNDKKAVNKLVDDISKRGSRQSGFTRITKLGLRRGDNAQIVKIALVDPKQEEIKVSPKKTKKAAPKTK